MTEPRASTAEATVAALVSHGIDTVYGLPGVHNDAFFDALYGARGRVRMLHARHEQTAAYMALGAALATGRPQAFVVVPGPGLLNASAALLTARGLDAPVLALVGQIPLSAIDRGYGHLHELPDQIGLLRHIVKFVARIHGPQDASTLVAEAIRVALSFRRGPVALECAIDVWSRVGPAPQVGPLPPHVPVPDPERVAMAAEILGQATKPMIVVGGGALDAAPQLRAVAEALDAPVVSYRRGRGILPTDHPLAVPFPVGHRLWSDTDAVLAVGTQFHVQAKGWGLDDMMKVVRIDIDPAQPDRFRAPACAINADAAQALAALLPLLPARPANHRDSSARLSPHRAWLAERLARLQPQMDFLHAMRAALPSDGFLVDEVTQMGFAARLAFPVQGPRLYLAPGYQDNLGWGFGTALGVAAACPGRAVLSVAGDGGFAYQGMELATAVLHRLPVVVVVFDDGAFGNVRRIQQVAYGARYIASDLANPDFAAFARSFGVAAFRAETPPELETALRKAFALRAPALVHVPVGEMPGAWDMILLPHLRGSFLGHALP